MKILNKLLPFRDFIYILQLEEYINSFYLDRLKLFFFNRDLQRKGSITWTSRAQTILLISVIFWLYPTIVTAAFTLLTNPFIWPVIIMVFTLSSILIPVWVLMANLILSPVYELIKRRIQHRQALRLRTMDNKPLVVMISGSYGKTTTKNFIHQLIKHKYRTQMTPGNINTPIGIAVWLRDKLQPGTEVLIVEADSDLPDKLRQCCHITPPDIAVLTNIGDQHLYRFGGTFAGLAKGLSEIFNHAQPTAKLITPTGTVDKLVGFSPATAQTLIEVDAEHPQLTYEGKQLETPQLSDSGIANLKLALKVAEVLGINPDALITQLDSLQLPDRRQKIITLHGFDVIDDSYNISFTTAKAGLDAALSLASMQKKQLLVITGGIPDLGSENADYNSEYGKLLGNQAHKILLLTTIFHQDLLQGIKQSEFDKKNLLNANSMRAAWDLIKQQASPEQVIVLMQPEMNDLYYKPE